MSISWSDIKEIFYAIGSMAGLFAFARPVIESRFQRDQERLRRLFEILPEQIVVELELSVYSFRRVSSDDFNRFNRIGEEMNSNQDGFRFSGPLRKRMCKETESLMQAYKSLRDLIQVPWWQPKVDEDADGTNHYTWNFDRSAFKGFDKPFPDYARHLEECAERAAEILRVYQRLQILSELHFLEAPFAGPVLRMRFRANGLA